MTKSGIPRTLRWIFFGLSIGTMISAGIFLKAYVAGGTLLGEGAKALMFFLLGTFFMLMYGENRGNTDNPGPETAAEGSTKGNR